MSAVQTSARERVALVALLVLATLLYARDLGAPSLEFDEGVYLSSADLLARGLSAGQDVFTSQPPLFFTLLDAGNDLVGGDAAGLRALAVLLALAATLAGWAIVRHIAGPTPALAATGLLALTPGVVDAAAVVSADVPSIAFGAGALVAARAARARPAWGLAAGALLVCALATKLLALPFGVALLAGALAARPPRAAFAWFAAGAGATLGALLAISFGALGPLYDGAVAFHLKARDAPAIAASDPLSIVVLIVLAYLGIMIVLLLGLARLRRPEALAWLRARADLAGLLAGGLLLCAIQRPLLHHHLVVVAWPLALLAASTLPPRPDRRTWGLAAAGAALALPLALHGRWTVPEEERARLAEIATLVRTHTAPTDAVVSDLPLVGLLAERPSALATVDPSYVRVSTGSLDTVAILRAADAAGAAVVGRSFREVPGLQAAIEDRFDRTEEVGGVAVYLRR